MKVMVFGSLNIDRTYYVKQLVRPGQTVAASEMRVFPGGKGLNQAVAFARAGSDTVFAGAVGADGGLLTDALIQNGVDTRLIKRADAPSGHAIIQVDAKGQNDIIILAGANGTIDAEYISRALGALESSDAVSLQNEISNVPLIIDRAREKGLKIIYNPSPCDARALECDINKTDWLVLNETEGAYISGESAPARILSRLRAKYPQTHVLLTLGESGSVYLPADGDRIAQPAFPVKAVDTTAAGDTFTGYFFTELFNGASPKRALEVAAKASAIAVSHPGASPSIPYRSEVSV